MGEKYEGFIKAYRSIRKHWLWEDKPFAKGQAWLDLLMLANHTDRKNVKGGVVTEYKRGQVCVSQNQLAEAWGWSRRKVKAFLDDLIADGMITISEPQKAPASGTVVSIENYTFWQGEQKQKAPQKAPPTHQASTTHAPPLHTNNNDNNYINIKNDYYYNPPSKTAEAMRNRLQAIGRGEIPKRGNL